MRTLEQESSLKGQRLAGAPLVTCADRSSSYAVRVEDSGIRMELPASPHRRRRVAVLEGFSLHADRGAGP